MQTISQEQPQSAPQPEPEFRARLAGLASQVCEVLNISHLLDYRCGRFPIASSLKVSHAMKVQCYDPEVMRFRDPALPSQFVFCALVQEPQDEEPEELLTALQNLSGVALIFAIETPVHTYGWWLLKIAERFDIQTWQRLEGGFFAVLYPQGEPALLS